jgi:hypothetical protein
MRSLRAVTACSLIVFLTLGCSYIPTTSLRYDPTPVATQVAPSATLVVLPFEEGRGPRRYPSMQGHMFKTYIPLLPYVKIPYERLDESYLLHQENTGSRPDPDGHFTVALAKAVARDLGESGLFREVHFARLEADLSAYDYSLSGTLRSTEFDVYASSYMLGVAGVLLWLIPIPVGRDKAIVSLDLAMRDGSKGGDVWAYSGSGSADKLFTLYNSEGESTSSPYRVSIKRYGSNRLGIDGDSLWAYHAEALRAVAQEVKTSLATYLSATQ